MKHCFPNSLTTITLGFTIAVVSDKGPMHKAYGKIKAFAWVSKGNAVELPDGDACNLINSRRVVGILRVRLPTRSAKPHWLRLLRQQGGKPTRILCLRPPRPEIQGRRGQHRGISPRCDAGLGDFPAWHCKVLTLGSLGVRFMETAVRSARDGPPRRVACDFSFLCRRAEPDSQTG